MIFFYIKPSSPEVRLQERRSKFLITKIIHRVSDEMEAASSGGLSTSVMIDCEEKSKEARKQKRLEEQDRREYLVYSFDEHQGFYRPAAAANTETGREAGAETGTETAPGTATTDSGKGKKSGDQSPSTSLSATVSLRDCVASSASVSSGEGGISLQLLSEEEEDEKETEAEAETETPLDAFAVIADESQKQGRGERDDRAEPLLKAPSASSLRPALSSLAKSQSLRVPRGLSPSPSLIRKTPTRSVSLKTFGGRDNNKNKSEGGGGTRGVVTWSDSKGALTSVGYNENILRIESYNEEERADEERMLREDSSLMAVSNE
jgi:hypothetical protein